MRGCRQHGARTDDRRPARVLPSQLFQGFTPPGVTVRSGIVCDHQGMCSRQLDCVVTLDSSLPVLGMKGDISLIPVESALMYIEIKSRIDRAALQQVEGQRESINRLCVAGTSATDAKFIFPAMLLGIDSKSLSAHSVADWMRHNRDTVVCCVVGQYFTKLNASGTIEIPKSTDASHEYRETLAFMHAFHDGLKGLMKMRQHEPVISAYLFSGISESDLIVNE